MRIVGGEIRHLQSPGGREVKTSFGVMRGRHAVVLLLRDSDGHSGLGESWVNFPIWSPWERVAAFEQAYLPYLQNKEVEDIPAFMAAMAKAFEGPATQARTQGALVASLCAVEAALWDLLAQGRKLPLCKLWFDNPAPRVAVYASGINAPLPFEWIDEMLAAGVKLFKLKLGFGRDNDLENLRAMKRHLGDKAELAVDANRNWDITEARHWVQALGEYKVRWLEEPLRPSDERYYPELRKMSAVPLAAGENTWLIPGESADVFDALDVDIWQPDITKNCTPSGALEVLRRSARTNRRCIPHYLGSAVGQALSLHLAAGCPEKLVEWDINPNTLRTGFFKDGFVIRDGCIELPRRPGLGWEMG